ncbi:MAG TPA: ABC transporter permease [Acidimicrobiales bacterium]
MSLFINLMIAGVVTGSIYAVSASGLVVTYNTTGIFNFAHGAVGMVLAYLFWQLWQGWHWNVLLALALTLLVAAPVLGAIIERVVMRPLYGVSTNIRLAVTLGLLLLLEGGAASIWSQSNVYIMPEFFTGDQVALGGVNLSYEQLITIGVAVAAALFLRLFFKRTRTGVAMRAVVDDPTLASLSGAPSGRIASYAWMIGVMFAGVAGILIASSSNMSILPLIELVIFGYAAAVVGRLHSIPLTFLGAMILGIGNSLVVGYGPASDVSDIQAALPMVLLFVVLLLIPEVRLTIGRVVRIRSPRVVSPRTSVIGGGAVVVVVLILSAVLSGSDLLTMGTALTLALLALSLTLLSGYAGQISLCQYTFLGLGALSMHWVGGGTSVLGVLFAVGLCAAVGAVLALPVLRLRGIYLALATLAFAVVMDDIFFTSNSVFGSSGAVQVGRPDIFGLRFATNRSFDVLIAVVLALCLIGVGALRRGPFGRRLVAMSDSPAACSTVGLSLTVTKLAVFALSAALAGLAGALYGGLQTSVGASQFQFLDSILIFAGVTLAGMSVLTGAVSTGIFIAVLPVIAARIGILNFPQLLIGIGIVAAGRNPNGIGTVYVMASDFWEQRTARARSPLGSDPPSAPAGAIEPEVSSVG